MGLFSGGNSKKTTHNTDSRTINDNSGSTFDNSVNTDDNSYHDSSTSYEDNSYRDNSTTDNSYHDSSRAYEDNSYRDNSVENSGDFANNTGSVHITDGGAFEVVGNAVSDLVGMAGDSFTLSQFSVETMGKTSTVALEQATMNNELMKDLSSTALVEFSDLSSNAMSSLESTAITSIESSQDNVEAMKSLADSAMANLAGQSASAISAAANANRDALEQASGVMKTVATNGNDLLVDGVVKIAKYIGIGLGVGVVGYGAIKLAGGKK